MVTRLSWIVNYRHDKDIVIPDASLIRAEPTVKLANKLQVPPDFTYVPLSLEFQPRFHSELAKSFPAWPRANGRPVLPYTSELSDGKQVEVSITGRLYEPRIISLNIDLKTDLEMSIEDLAKKPDYVGIRNHPLIDRLVQNVLRQIVAGDSGNDSLKSSRYDQYPVVEISNIPTDHFPTWQEISKQDIARVLIRNVTDGAMRDELVEKLFVKSEQFNFKTNREYILVDKQGILALSALHNDVSSDEARKKTLKSATYLVEIGLVYRAFLDSFIPLRISNDLVADYIYSRIESWCAHPVAVLRHSVTGAYLWERIAQELKVMESFELIASRAYVCASVATQLEVFDRVANSNNHWYEELESLKTANGGGTVGS